MDNEISAGDKFANTHGKQVIAGIFAIPLAIILVVETVFSAVSTTPFLIFLGLSMAFPTSFTVIVLLSVGIMSAFVWSCYLLLPSKWSRLSRLSMPLIFLAIVIGVNIYGAFGGLAEFTL